MHLLLGTVVVIIVWGIGMIVRPAATLFLTVLVVGFLYFVTHPYVPDQSYYSQWTDARGITHYR
jgi:hypothetical protein